jgi:hypothetical protein
MTMQNPQARQFRQRPRPTHMWDPERGVIPLNPNAPAGFVPPPPPGVTEAYMQGMARRQGVARDLGDPSRLRPDPGRAIGRSGIEGVPGPTPTDPGVMGGNAIPEHELLAMEGIIARGGPDAGPTMLSTRPSGPIDTPMPRSPIMSPYGDVELRHFWPTLPPQNIPLHNYARDWDRGHWEGLRSSGEFVVPPRQRY